MYQVKTRNWNCKRWVQGFLNVSKIAGAWRGDSYTDGDGKYILETSNSLKAWLVWFYFTALSYFSGGWTYICRPGTSPDFRYKRIY